MIIGIDIDDVLTNTSQIMKDYLEKYEKSGDGVRYIVEVMRGEIPTENIKKFFKEYINEICKNVTLKSKAKDVIQRLLNEGHEIIFITSRGETKFPGTEKTTLEYLKNNNVNYTNIIFNSFDKQIDCINNDIEIMIDDSIKNCEAIKKEEIKTILYTSEVNKKINTYIERVENWIELECKINEYKK